MFFKKSYLYLPPDKLLGILIMTINRVLAPLFLLLCAIGIYLPIKATTNEPSYQQEAPSSADPSSTYVHGRIPSFEPAKVSSVSLKQALLKMHQEAIATPYQNTYVHNTLIAYWLRQNNLILLQSEINIIVHYTAVYFFLGATSAEKSSTIFSQGDQEEKKNDVALQMGATFSVMSYNTHLFGDSWASYIPKTTKDDDERAKQMALLLERGFFDFIGMQEVFDEKYFKLFKKLKCITTIYATCKPQGKSFWLLPKIVPDGLVLMGKSKIEDCEKKLFEASSGMEKLVTRGVVCGYVPEKVKENNAPFCIFVTHTHWGGDDVENREVRMKNIIQLRKIIDNYRSKHNNVGYLILADLNITQGTADYDKLMEIFSDCKDADCGNEATCDPESNQLLQMFHPAYIQTGKTKIDYILYSKAHWTLIKNQVLCDMFQTKDGEDLSDHYPIYAKFKQKIVEQKTSKII